MKWLLIIFTIMNSELPLAIANGHDETINHENNEPQHVGESNFRRTLRRLWKVKGHGPNTPDTFPSYPIALNKDQEAEIFLPPDLGEISAIELIVTYSDGRGFQGSLIVIDLDKSGSRTVPGRFQLNERFIGGSLKLDLPEKLALSRLDIKVLADDSYNDQAYVQVRIIKD